MKSRGRTLVAWEEKRRFSAIATTRMSSTPQVGRVCSVFGVVVLRWWVSSALLSTRRLRDGGGLCGHLKGNVFSDVQRFHNLFSPCRHHVTRREVTAYLSLTCADSWMRILFSKMWLLVRNSSATGRSKKSSCSRTHSSCSCCSCSVEDPKNPKNSKEIWDGPK